MHLSQRRHLHRVIINKGRLYIVTFTFLSENFVNQLTLTHRLIHVQADRQTECPNLILALTRDVKSGIFLNRL